MFRDDRTFDLKTMLSNDDKLYYYPVNHSYYAVMMVDGEGDRYASTVTKTGHQEELNHLILMKLMNYNTVSYLILLMRLILFLIILLK